MAAQLNNGTIVWDEDGKKRFETGVDHAVLYLKQSEDATISALGENDSHPSTKFYNGVAWNGITSVSKSPSGADANDIYADNIKYASIRSAETFGGTIEAYTYPDEFAECDGSIAVGGGVFVGQQVRKPFGFCFRTDIGDDSDSGIDVGKKYKLHLVYNATASPSQQSFSTINDSPEAITFSWEITTIPAVVGTVGGVRYNPTACITIDITKLSDYDATTGTSAKMTAFENILYGTQNTAPMLPMPKDVIAHFKTA